MRKENRNRFLHFSVLYEYRKCVSRWQRRGHPRGGVGAAVGAAGERGGAGAPRGARGPRRRARLLAAAAAARRGHLRALHQGQPTRTA